MDEALRLKETRLPCSCPMCQLGHFGYLWTRLLGDPDFSQTSGFRGVLDKALKFLRSTTELVSMGHISVEMHPKLPFWAIFAIFGPDY